MERVIAHCEVAGRPVVEMRRPVPVRVAVGEPLVLRFTYHVHEESRAEDEWRFTLTARCDGEPVQEEKRAHRDHFMLRDQVEDSLAVEYVFEEEGEAVVRFEAVAQMRSTPWVDTTVRPKVRRDRATGAVRVQVSTRPS